MAAIALEGDGGVKREEREDDVSVWDTVGTPPERYFVRFGDGIDQVMFGIMRLVSNIDAVWVPVLLSFGQLQWLKPLVANPLCVFVDSIMNCLYFIGVLLQLRTSVVILAVAQEWVNPVDVFKLRFGSVRFWLDFVSVIGAFWWLPVVPTNIAILRMLRLWRLSAGADDLYELHLATLTSEDALHNFLQLSVKMLLMIHNFTCAWFFAATMSSENWENVMQEDPRLPSVNLSSLYLVYFSDGAGMLAGWVGPPSFSPDGLYSRCELIVWSILAPTSALCMAWIFAQLLEVVQQASASTDKHLDKLAELSAVLDSLFVPADLKQRCLSYHSFMSIHNANKEEYDTLFSSLSANLQLDIKVHLFDDLVRKAPFFKAVPEHVMTKLVLAFEEEVYGPGQFIFYKGEYGEELFFIMRGSVEVVGDGGELLAVLSIGQFFGELALVLDQPRMASTRAKSFTMLAKITRELFQEVLEEDPVVKGIVMDEIAKRQKATQVAARESSRQEEARDVPQVTTPLLSDRGDEQIRPELSEIVLSNSVPFHGEGSASPQPPACSESNGKLLEDIHRTVSRNSLSDSLHATASLTPSMLRKSHGIFHHDSHKGGGVSSVDVHQLLSELSRMGQIAKRFQGKFEGIEIRLRNMEAAFARGGS